VAVVQSTSKAGGTEQLAEAVSSCNNLRHMSAEPRKSKLLVPPNLWRWPSSVPFTLRAFEDVLGGHIPWSKEITNDHMSSYGVKKDAES
jgi:hypothetical protein